MATNPARPQFQDTIDEAWGGQVADHVIRRYLDEAARDADLAGIAAADLAGQVIAIVPGGDEPYLMQHDGTQWDSPAPRGRILSVQGPAAQQDNTTEAWVLQVNVTFKAGRRYKVTAFARGYDTGGVAWCSYLFYPPKTNMPWGIHCVSTQSSGNQWFAGSCTWEHSNTTAVDEVNQMIGITASAASPAITRTPTNACYLLLEDIGSVLGSALAKSADESAEAMDTADKPHSGPIEGLAP